MTTSGVPEEQHTLITGGAGFIGSHLTERLLKSGEKVVVIDDLSTGSLENLPKTKDKTRLRFIKSEVTSCEELDQIVAKYLAKFVSPLLHSLASLTMFTKFDRKFYQSVPQCGRNVAIFCRSKGVFETR